MENLITLSPKLNEVAEKLNNSVIAAIGNDKMIGFQKAYLISNAIAELKQLLTPEYMKPIMELQGNKLGFKTDKDTKGGYSESEVKNCLIEAVLFGLQPCGNQFNIIAGNMYATKEGCGYLLSKVAGLRYSITSELPRVKDTSAAIVMNIQWTINEVSQTEKLDIPIKVNAYMGTDAIIGKATRKARKWLYDTITGSEIPEGDISDLDKVNSGKTIDIETINFQKEQSRVIEHINNIKTIAELESFESTATANDCYNEWALRLEQLKKEAKNG
jgi:hypothetical protein